MYAAAVIWAPARVLGRAAAERDVLAGFIVTALYAALGLAAAAFSVFGGITRAVSEGDLISRRACWTAS